MGARSVKHLRVCFGNLANLRFLPEFGANSHHPGHACCCGAGHNLIAFGVKVGKIKVTMTVRNGGALCHLTLSAPNGFVLY